MLAAVIDAARLLGNGSLDLLLRVTSASLGHILICCFNIIAELPGTALSFGQTLCAARDALCVVEREGTYICVQDVAAHGSLDTRFDGGRRIAVGTEVRTTHILPLDGDNGSLTVPAAMKLMDGCWVDCREAAGDSVWSALFKQSEKFVLPLGLVKHLSGSEATLVVCQDRVDVQASCLPNSPVVGAFLQGDLLHAKRRVTCWEAAGDHVHRIIYLIEVDDDKWVTVGLPAGWGDTLHSIIRNPTLDELNAGPRQRRLLVRIHSLEHDIKGLPDKEYVSGVIENLDTTDLLYCEVLGMSRAARLRQELQDDLVRAQEDLALLQQQLAEGTLRDAAPTSAVPEMQPPVPEPPTLSTVCAAVFGGIFASLLRGLLEVPGQEFPGSLSPSMCFLPGTMIWTSKASSLLVEALRPGDTVMNAFGNNIKVASTTVHEESLCQVVELRTREHSLKVSSTHRIVVPYPAADVSQEIMDIKEAGDMKAGDLVFSGCPPLPVPLVKVLKHPLRTRMIEIVFDPDDPVETFMAPKWCLLTRGSPATWDATDDEF